MLLDFGFEVLSEDAVLLSQAVDVTGWPGSHLCKPLSALPDGLSPIRASASPHPATEAFPTACYEILIFSEDDFNVLDANSGDGDTGSALASAARALMEAMDTLPLVDHKQLYRAIGLELSQTMGGSSGVLLAIFFAAAGDASSSGQSMWSALQSGLDRMRHVDGANSGDCTMIDALIPALEALDDGFVYAATVARKGTDYTARLTTAKAGLAIYINAEQLADHVDPGAEAVARLFEHLVL